MDGQALPVRYFRWSRFWVYALAALGLAGAAFVITAVVWLRSYAPLAQGSAWGGLAKPEGVTVTPLSASGDVPVLFPRYRPHGRFHVRLTVANTGRLGVTLVGVETRDDHVFAPIQLQVAPPLGYGGGYLRALDAHHPARIEPGSERMVTITYRFSSRCVGGQPRRFWTEPAPSAESVLRTVAFRFRYARWFERSQLVQMPFAVALVCNRGVVPG